MDYAKEAERHRAMAEEMRTMATCTPHESLRERYLTLAEGYDQLADNEVRVAENMSKISNRRADPDSQSAAGGPISGAC